MGLILAAVDAPQTLWQWIVEERFYLLNGLVQGAAAMLLLLLGWMTWRKGIHIKKLHIPWAVLALGVVQKLVLEIIRAARHWDYSFAGGSAQGHFVLLLQIVVYVLMWGFCYLAAYGLCYPWMRRWPPKHNALAVVVRCWLTIVLYNLQQVVLQYLQYDALEYPVADYKVRYFGGAAVFIAAAVVVGWVALLWKRWRNRLHIQCLNCQEIQRYHDTQCPFCGQKRQIDHPRGDPQ